MSYYKPFDSAQPGPLWLASHLAYWTPERLQREREAAKARVRIKRAIRKCREAELRSGD